MQITYPTKCRIIDVTGLNHKVGPYTAKTPEDSKPYIGMEGIARRIGSGVLITLDNGVQLPGHDCWWEPLD